MKYLTSSKSIKEELHKLFSNKGKKLAIVAFVGSKPTTLLPDGINNLHVICWPLAGGTHPDGIRQLISAGIKVSFCDDMHIKLFYREGAGVIIGSANLSTNALNGGQHEFCVFIDDEKFAIGTVLSQISPIYPVSEDNLSKLDLEHNIYTRKNPAANTSTTSKCPTFQEATRSAFPKKWKIATFSEDLPEEDVIELQDGLIATFGAPDWTNYHGIEEEHFKPGDFILQVEVSEKSGKAINKPRWLFVDHIAKITSTSVVVELTSTPKSTRPFEVNNEFSKAFKLAFNSGECPTMTDSNGFVTNDFASLIYSKLETH
ncbi:phospholipase D-like domain-containing protein [Pseudaquabacterium rugosum]|uniref:Phospholipase D-like domain-containing protein n=1 Tax=Pseudaquabacterium rugosum TaxID=2984194 RepID=A0ABU9BFW0_9BURK